MIEYKKGKIVQSSEKSIEPHEDVVHRMHVLIGLIQTQEVESRDPFEMGIALEMLKDMLPTPDQVSKYLKDGNRNN